MSMKCVLKSLGTMNLVKPTSGIGTNGAICRTQVEANFNREDFSRRTSENVEKQIKDLWDAKCLNNPRLYNASKFRLAGWCVSEGKCVINIGLTSYKDLFGTNLAPNFREIQEKGRTELNEPQAYISDAIGVGILLLTIDGCLVVTRRASWTGEYPSMLDRPGGHPEPDNVFTPDGELKPEYRDGGGVNHVVMEEIWNSVCQEAQDELGLNKEHIQDMRLLGLAFSLESGGRPGLEFFARLCMKSEELKALYSLGQQKEADETTALHLIPSSITSLLGKLLMSENGGPETPEGEEGEEGVKERATEGGIFDASAKEVAGEANSNISKAKALLQDATPFLKAALFLAADHSLI